MLYITSLLPLVLLFHCHNSGNAQVHSHTQRAYAHSSGSGRAIWHHWIMSPALMICWCRLGADCFMCWMKGVQPLRPSAAGFHTLSQYPAAGTFYVRMMSSTVHIRTYVFLMCIGLNTLDLYINIFSEAGINSLFESYLSPPSHKSHSHWQIG